MKRAVQVLWAGEPAVFCGVLAVIADAVILLPDWRRAVAVAGVASAAAGATRKRVSPKRGA